MLNARFIERKPMAVMAPFFGAECQDADVDPAASITDAEWAAVDAGDTASGPSVRTIASVVALRSAVCGPRLVPGKYPATYVVAHDDLARLEAFSLALAWPARRAALLAGIPTLPTPSHPARVRAWLADVGAHMESSIIEADIYDIYSAAMTPFAILVRAPPKRTSYQAPRPAPVLRRHPSPRAPQVFRDLHLLHPQPRFDVDILHIMGSTPVNLLLGPQSLPAYCAALAIAKAFINTHSNTDCTVVTGRPPTWCPRNAIYFVADHPPVLCDADGVLHLIASHADAAYHLITQLARLLPRNADIVSAAAAITAPSPRTADVPWA